MDLPEPLVPADADLRNFSYMPLYFRRLFASDGWSTGSGDEIKAAICLWCESWHQLPAGSLPNDDRILKHLAQVNGWGWKRVKEFALRGWFLCGDGRLYNTALSPIAAETWARIQGQRKRTEEARKVALEHKTREKVTRKLRESYEKVERKLRESSQPLSEMSTQENEEKPNKSTNAASVTEQQVLQTKSTKGREGKGNKAYYVSPNVDTLSGNDPDRTSQEASIPSKKRNATEAAKRCIEYLNEKAGARYRATDANIKFPVARILQDAATEQELKAVVDAKVKDWLNDPEMRRFLRPETLWNSTKFSQYVGQLNLRDPPQSIAPPDAACVVMVLGQADEVECKPLCAIQVHEKVDPESLARQGLQNEKAVRSRFPNGGLRNIIVEFEQFGQHHKHVFSINELRA